MQPNANIVPKRCGFNQSEKAYGLCVGQCGIAQSIMLVWKRFIPAKLVNKYSIYVIMGTPFAIQTLGISEHAKVVTLACMASVVALLSGPDVQRDSSWNSVNVLGFFANTRVKVSCSNDAIGCAHKW